MPLECLHLKTESIVAHGEVFELFAERFEIVGGNCRVEGDGANVLTVQDRKTGEPACLKKIGGFFKRRTHAKRVLRELRILRHLQHDNIEQLLFVYTTGCRSAFDDIYVVYDLMEADLSSVIRNQELSETHAAFLLYQVLRGLKYIHSADIVHCDLKPRNLMVTSDCDLKIRGFGMARVNRLPGEWSSAMTQYVFSPWYRAPEVLCSWVGYTPAIDVWSVGCILHEIVQRTPLLPGGTIRHQVTLIVSLLGSPESADLERLAHKNTIALIKSMPGLSAKPIAEVLPNASEPVQDFVKRTLQWSPSKRPSAVDALKHPFIVELTCDDDEPMREPVDKQLFEFERRRIDISRLRDELFHEVLCYSQFQKEVQDTAEGLKLEITSYPILTPSDHPEASSDDEP